MKLKRFLDRTGLLKNQKYVNSSEDKAENQEKCHVGNLPLAQRETSLTDRIKILSGTFLRAQKETPKSNNGFVCNHAVVSISRGGICKLDIDEALAYAIDERIEVPNMTIGDTSWNVVVQNDQGCFRVHLKPLVENAQWCHITAKICDHQGTFAGCLSEFASGKVSPNKGLTLKGLSMNEVKKMLKDFKATTFFRLELMVRPSVPELERFALCKHRDVIYASWSFNRLKDLCPTTMRCKPFQLGKAQMWFEICRKGQRPTDVFNFSVHAQSLNKENVYKMDCFVCNHYFTTEVIERTFNHLPHSEKTQRARIELFKTSDFTSDDSCLLKDGWMTIGVRIREFKQNLTSLPHVLVKLLIADVLSTDLYSTFKVDCTLSCTFSREYKVNHSEDLNCLTKFLKEMSREKSLNDFWLCTETDNGKEVELVERASVVRSACLNFDDLCGGSSKPIIFLLPNVPDGCNPSILPVSPSAPPLPPSIERRN